MLNTTDYDKLQQTTLSMVCHEIRNPLTLIYSTLQLIESQHPEVTDFRYWPSLRQDLDYMVLLLDELSLYNNSRKLTLSNIDSNTFFRKLSLSFAASIANTDIEFVSKIAPGLPALQCDTIKLREVFLNLLTNARDAVSDSKEPSIHLSVTERSGFLHITIRDNGCGIPEDHLETIFDPFVTYKKNGTGLGLAITNHIVKAHHGTIHATSAPHTGTTFTLTLPVKQDA